MKSEASSKIPFFWGHGTEDPVMRLEYALMSKHKLESLKQPLEFHQYPGLTHSVAPEEIMDVLAFLENKIPA